MQPVRSGTNPRSTLDLSTLLRRRRAVVSFKPDPIDRGRLDAVLDAARDLPLPGPITCNAVLLEGDPMRAALLRNAEPEAAGAALDPLRSAPRLIALCDPVADQASRAAAWVAAAQMALVAEEVGLAAVLVPWDDQTERASDLPLPRSDRIIAILGIGWPSEDKASPAHPAAPRGVTTYFASPPPPRVEGDADRDQQVLTSFIEIAAATALAEDLDAALTAIARALGKIFPVDGASLALLEDDAVIVREVLRRDEAVRRDPVKLPADDSHLMGAVIGNGRPLLRNDVRAEVRFAESLPGTRMLSDMTIPLRIRGQRLGAFGVACRKRHAFDLADFEVLQRCADLTAVAVETQRLLLKTRRLAEIDGLTEVFNHRHFVGLLEQEIEAARRTERSLALLMIDVDDFKRTNDTHGHPAGDRVLHHVAQLTVKLLRRSDAVARYGGEEFAAILPDSNLQGAMQAAETVRAGIERSTVPIPALAHSLFVRVSVGVALYPEDAATAGDLVQAADRGLYEAKRTGKNRVCHRSIPSSRARHRDL